jgi:hypothetical protein
MAVVVVVVVFIRTGWVFDQSTARLALVPAAILPQRHPPPQIDDQLLIFRPPRHGLVHVGKELGHGWSPHKISLLWQNRPSLRWT